MSGQSSSKGGYGQSYGQPYGGYGQSSYGYGYPGQQGSFFSAGGSARPSLPQGGYQTLPYQIPDGGIPQGMPNPYQIGRTMDTGPQFGSNFTGYGGPSGPTGSQIMAGGNPYGQPTGAQIMAGGNPYYNSAAQSAAQNAAMAASPLSRGGATYGGGVPLSTQGTTQAQQNMGIGMTPQGTLSFAPSGNLNQISASTASLMGARNNGQGQWVNAQGQVIGLV